MASSSHQPSTKLQHGGNAFSQLTSKQQSDIHAQLPLQCHSLETLKRSGVILDLDPLPHHIVKKQGLDMAAFEPSPNANRAIEKRKAIVMACQAAETSDGGLEPVSICVIDFFTGQTLIDSFIAPSCELSDWRTGVHGVSGRTIEDAVKGNNCLRSWREARMRLFEYVDAQTILVGYGVSRDLEVLRVFHRGVVDAQILAIEAVFTAAERWRDGIKSKWEIDRVCMGLLGMKMRANAKEKGVWDPYENVLAAREIVLRFLQRPGDVSQWVKRERLEMFGDAVKEEEEEDVGKSATRARRGSRKTGRKEPSHTKQEANQKAKMDGNRRQNRAAGAKESAVQSLKELSLGDARQGPNTDEKQKGVASAVSEASHIQDSSERQQTSRKSRAGRTRRRGNKVGTEAREKAKREASLKAMVREEERAIMQRGGGKQGARTDWETKNRAERRAKWVESQRDGPD
ncbi:hypothetical protein J3F83DRAFT_756386 [Trichoderma novae-zelandiae]